MKNKMKTYLFPRLLVASLMLAAFAPLQGAPDPGAVFKRIDSDGSGTVSASELETHMVSMTNRQAKNKGWDQAEVQSRIKGASKRAQGRIKRQDKDGDGELSLEEWSAEPAKGKKQMGKKD